jgi:hypothetical protein
LSTRLGLKLAESRRILRGLDAPLTVTLLNPVYKETGRMQPRKDHPHGEDSIRHKVNTLRRLESLSEHLTTRLVVVDDECPNDSGGMAQEILRKYGDAFENGTYRVFYLREAIDAGDLDLPPGLTHKDGSRRSVKGGALLYGMRKALHHGAPGLHVLVDNDADLSVHPGQIGLLIEDILRGEAQAVAGSRREPDSVAVVGGSRDARGRLFIQIWQHLLPGLARRITDTNRAFKAFSAPALRKILPEIQIYTFPYQIELLQACITHGIPLRRRGIAYVDSEAASTQQGAAITETYLDQIRQIIDISQRYRALDPADPLLRFFQEISEERWQEIEGDPAVGLEDLLAPGG